MSTPLASTGNDVQTTLGAPYVAGSGTVVLATGYGATLAARVAAAGFAAISSSAPLRFTLIARSALNAYGQITNVALQCVYTATGLSGDTLSGVAAAEGGTDQPFAAGDTFACLWTAGQAESIQSLLGTVAANQVADEANIATLETEVAAIIAGTTLTNADALQGNAVSTAAPTDTYVLTWVASTSKWTPQPAGGGVTSVCGDTGAVTLAQLVSAGVAPLASPAFTGAPTGPTPATADNSTKLATTAYVQAQGYLTSAPSAGSTDQIQFNAGSGAFGASSSLTWNPTDSNITVGTVIVGGWHVAAGYLVVGNANLNQTVNGNYALIQSNVGQTIVNSSSGNTFNVRVNNNDYIIANNNAAIGVLFITNSASANFTFRGMASQTAPLLALQGVSSTSTDRDLGYVDGGYSNSTDATYTGFVRLCAQDHNAPAGGREGVRVDSSGTAAKLGFYGAATVIQPTAGGVTTGYTSGSSTAVTIDGKFAGSSGSSKYTIGDIVTALKAVGLLAS